MRSQYIQDLHRRRTEQRYSLYRSLVIHRIVLREEGAWAGEAFGSKLLQQDCTRIGLFLARFHRPR